jgi:hypothetical protein
MVTKYTFVTFLGENGTSSFFAQKDNFGFNSLASHPFVFATQWIGKPIDYGICDWFSNCLFSLRLFGKRWFGVHFRNGICDRFWRK